LTRRGAREVEGQHDPEWACQGPKGHVSVM
jgi:hypothetical protein